MAAALLLGCQGAPSTPAAPVRAHLHQPADVEAPALNPKGFRAVILAADGGDDLELFGLYYGLVSHGWRVQVARPGAGAARGQAGYPVPGARIQVNERPIWWL